MGKLGSFHIDKINDSFLLSNVEHQKSVTSTALQLCTVYEVLSVAVPSISLLTSFMNSLQYTQHTASSSSSHIHYCHERLCSLGKGTVSQIHFSHGKGTVSLECDKLNFRKPSDEITLLRYMLII